MALVRQLTNELAGQEYSSRGTDRARSPVLETANRVVEMNFLVAVLAFLLGGLSVIALGVSKVNSFLDGIRDLIGL